MADTQNSLTENERLKGLGGAITVSGAEKFNEKYPLSTRKLQFVGAKVGWITSGQFDSMIAQRQNEGHEDVEDRGDLAQWIFTRQFQSMQGQSYPPNTDEFIPITRVTPETYDDGEGNIHTFVTLSVLLSRDKAQMLDNDRFNEIGFFCQACMNNPVPWGYSVKLDSLTMEDVVVPLSEVFHQATPRYRRGDIVIHNNRYWVALETHDVTPLSEPRIPGEELNAKEWIANDPLYANQSPPLGTIVKYGVNERGIPSYYELIAYPTGSGNLNPDTIPEWSTVPPQNIVQNMLVFYPTKASGAVWKAKRNYEETVDNLGPWPWYQAPAENDTLWERIFPKWFNWGDYPPDQYPAVWRLIDLEYVPWQEMRYPRDTTVYPPRWVAVPGPEGDPFLLYYVPKYEYPLCLEFGHTIRYAIGIQLHSAQEIESIVIPQEDTVGFPELQLAYLSTMNSALRSTRDVWRENQVLRTGVGQWVAGTQYSRNNIVMYNDRIYRSMVDNNRQTSFSLIQSNTRRWIEVTTDIITLRDNWDIGKIYNMWDIVVWNGRIWNSNTSNNRGNEPGNEPASPYRWTEVM